MFLAMRIEKRYTKAEILEFYLNRIYFGSGFYGIRSASLGYFGKEPMDLTGRGVRLARHADQEPEQTLAAQQSGDQPRGPQLRADAHGGGRLHFLVRAHPAQGAAAGAQSQAAAPRHHAPLRARRRSRRRWRWARTRWHPAASRCTPRFWRRRRRPPRKRLQSSLARAESRPGYRRQKYEDYRKNQHHKPAEYLQGACLMVDHETGEVLAHVGGRDYAQVPYDFIETGQTPAGHRVFPVHLCRRAWSTASRPATIVEDEPMDNRSVMVGGREGILGEWGMEVPSPVYEGKIPAREALEHSKIGATVRFADQTGLQRVVDTACAFGLPLAESRIAAPPRGGFRGGFHETSGARHGRISLRRQARPANNWSMWTASRIRPAAWSIGASASPCRAPR